VTNPAQTLERVLRLDGSTAYDSEVVGGKGASIARMRALGLPVPPAFVIPIEECRRYHAAGRRLEDALWKPVLEGIAALERDTGRRFGDASRPLLVSVRSGAAVSMPGMMDTVLNLGMTNAVEQALAGESGDDRFARNTHVRFIHEFGHTVLGADSEPPSEDAGADEVRAAVRQDTGEDVPTDPHEQLRAAIHAVFDSWVSRRAIAYRKHWSIPEDGGTAVVVQAMVFGNLGAHSGTGVLFTRNPLSGAPEIYGEWLPRGQGEDVVSGSFDPLPLAAMAEQLSEAHAELIQASRLLERENRDVQDVEFTVEKGRLYLLQTRAAKRSPLASVRTAVELARDGLIDKATALERVRPEHLAAVLAPRLSHEVTARAEVLARGTPACPGVACGRVVPNSDAAEEADGDVILARPTTSPQDVAGMIAARGVVTERGGSTSHAAVVSRALGRPSVVGVGEGVTSKWEDAEVTVDGTSGVVYAQRLPRTEVTYDDVPGLRSIVEWASELSPVEVVDAAPESLDLDQIGLELDPEAGVDIAALADRMRDAPAVAGSLLSTADGARAVLRSGVRQVVARRGQHKAILLLVLVQASRQHEEEQ
jgi:pyruvate,orthophosphate dikinase